MKKSTAVLAALFLLLGSALAKAQGITVQGTCTVKVSGENNLSFKGQAPATGDNRASQSNNILWLRQYYAGLKAKKPQGAAVYDNMLAAAEASGVFSLSCASGKNALTISSLGYDIEPDAFAGKTGTYVLVGANNKGEQPPGFMAGLIAAQGGALLTLTPNVEPGELTISTFTDREIGGSFTFTAKGSTVSGDFAFERMADE